MASPVRYRISRADEVPVGDAWLTAREREQLARFRVRKRIADWRLGRYAAKVAVAGALDEPRLEAREVEIRTTRGGAPSAWSGPLRLPLEISISHTARRALCVVAPLRRAIGCDLERVGSPARGARSEAGFLIGRELAWLEALADSTSRATWVTLAWSAKESALKAIGDDRPVAARGLELRAPAAPRLPGSAWERFEVAEESGTRRWSGWWRLDDGWALTVAGATALDAPLALP